MRAKDCGTKARCSGWRRSRLCDQAPRAGDVRDVPGVQGRWESDARPCRTFTAALRSVVVILKSEEPAPVF